MASGFTHIFVGEALGKIYTEDKMPARFWVLAGACSVVPDLDIIAFYLRVPYSHMFGHRGFSHSLLFAAFTGMLTALLAFRDVPRWSGKWWRLAFFFFLVTASHGVLDAMTNGGYGIGFFSPFDNTRYFLPWRPLVVSPIGVHGFFTRWGWDVIKSEFIWVWLPMTAVSAWVIAFRKKKKNHLSS
jgi:inner membrane protein